jgi:hypothetical protein
MFRDQTQHVLAKAKSLDSRGASRRSTSGSGAKQRGRGTSGPPTFPSRSLDLPVQVVATNFFLNDYSKGSHFDYLPSLLDTACVDKVLMTAVRAVGLACLSQRTSDPSVMTQSRTKYAEALTLTNQSLQACRKDLSDTTVASVLLLALYETICVEDKMSKAEDWSTHIQGALALANMRGARQFETSEGIKIFQQLAVSIRTACVQTGARIPQELRDLTDVACMATPNGRYTTLGAITGFTELKADIMTGILHNPADIIKRAQDLLDLMLTVKSEHTARHWQGTTFLQTPLEGMHSSFYHTFPDHHSAQACNIVWMGDLRLHELIYQQAIRILGYQVAKLPGCLDWYISEWPGSDGSALSQATNAPAFQGLDIQQCIDNARKGAEQAAQNICASIPQFFPPASLKLPKSVRSAPPSIAAGYFLIWPLFTVGSGILTTPETKAYVMTMLKRIASELRLPQATKAAELLEMGHQENWMHMCHVF